MSPRNWRMRIEDIFEALEKIEAYTEGLDEKKWNKDDKTIDAVIRNIEIIGEASIRVPEYIKDKYPQIPWYKMQGMRNILNKASSFDLLTFIVNAEMATGHKVDVVVLNTASEVMKYQVRKFGIPLFDQKPSIRKDFEIRSRKYFEDFLHLHKKYTNKALYGRSSTC